jgi:hypothetical protein
LHYKYEEEFLFFCHWEKLKKEWKRKWWSKEKREVSSYCWTLHQVTQMNVTVPPSCHSQKEE